MLWAQTASYCLDIHFLKPRGVRFIKLIFPAYAPDKMALLFPLIPSIMDGRTYRFAPLTTQTTSMSGHLADIASNPSLDPGSFRQVPQGSLPVLDGVWTNSPSPEISEYPFNQADAKARFLVG